MRWTRPVTLVNARVAADGGEAETLRFAARVLDIGGRPRPCDLVIDLDGAFVLPGLVNAHDHLELNHYGRLKFRDRYDNVRAWIDDMRPRLGADARLRAGRAHPLRDRLFAGALKNALSGVTTVAHHNPFYRELWRWMPVRVLRRYGWAHSFGMERQPAGARGEPGGDVAARYRRTPPSVPFFVHLAEGIDAAAAGELVQFERAGCLRPNAVLVHGVAVGPGEWPRVARAGAGLVWCPGSNLFLFGRTAAIGAFVGGTPSKAACRIALGTDSRLSGTTDLLDELRLAERTGAAGPAELLAMVTTGAADVLGLPHAGRLRAGAPADLIVVPAGAPDAARALLRTRRADVRLVAVGGQPLVGDPGLAGVFDARRAGTQPVLLDGRPKVLSVALARRIAASAIQEPGVDAA